MLISSFSTFPMVSHETYFGCGWCGSWTWPLRIPSQSIRLIYPFIHPFRRSMHRRYRELWHTFQTHERKGGCVVSGSQLHYPRNCNLSVNSDWGSLPLRQIATANVLVCFFILFDKVTFLIKIKLL